MSHRTANSAERSTAVLRRDCTRMAPWLSLGLDIIRNDGRAELGPHSATNGFGWSALLSWKVERRIPWRTVRLLMAARPRQWNIDTEDGNAPLSKASNE